MFVLALSPFHVWYSQEGRMYSQVLFLSLFSSVLLLQALKRGKARWWVYYVLISAAGMYTHVFMGLALAAQFLWLVAYHRQYLLRIIVSGLVVAALFLPWMLFLPWVIGFAHSVSAHGITGGFTSGGRAGFTWAAVPYTMFVYSAGFSLGPSVAELHANRTSEFILAFLPTIVPIMSIFGVLFAVGLFAMPKYYGNRSTVYMLLALFVPLAGALAYSLTARGTFNVRYTVIAYPYFCVFIGTALAHISDTKKVLRPVAVLAIIGISSASLYNYFCNSRYAKEDIRSAVNIWRQAGGNEPLLASGARYTILRYLGTSKSKYAFDLGNNAKNIVPAIEKVLLSENMSSAYVLLARDWDKGKEKAVRSAFRGSQEHSFPGVKVFRISRSRTFQSSATSSGAALSLQQ
jgi:uncharacterized membrane protein